MSFKESHAENLNRIPPVDFSFRKLDTLRGLTSNEKPRGGRVMTTPNKGPRNNYITAGIWLNNNSLESTEHLAEMIDNTIEFPQRLAWLDLSFNNIDRITNDIAKFPNLKILYLHGNNIQDLQAVLILRPLTALRTLTLHGNPIETFPSYRAYVIKILKNLVNLDFTTIVPREKNAPVPPGLSELVQLFDDGPSVKKKVFSKKEPEASKDENG